ncbi:MAG TPA: glutamate--tRNA ligase [Geminicoccaceae bacterium]|nr:glutamate--tRNA ligase [Geminicoccaceae bacterium]
MSVVTRFAPSPTGFLHIGGARTALFNWLFARHHGGRYLLRIEDTDRARSTEAAIQAILDGLGWLGLVGDELPVFQSQRSERHAEVARALLERGAAYRCYSTPDELQAMRERARAEGRWTGYDGRWRDRDPAEAPAGIAPAVRLKSPRTGETVVPDRVQGEVRFDNAQLDDMVLLRADGTPTYMLSVVVDDHDMGVTHVIRGDDHLTNTARQTLIYQGLGWDRPAFAHVPLIHGPDGAKLSKRHGALGVDTYREMGFLPEALRNYLLRLGWSHGDDEVISTEQAIAWFDLDAVGKGAARFDMARLTNLNAHYLRTTDDATLARLIAPRLAAAGHTVDEEALARLQAGMAGLKPRATTLVDLAARATFYVAARPLTLSEKAAELLDPAARERLADLLPALAGLPVWEEAALEQAVRSRAEALGIKLGQIAQPLRAALTGSDASPGIFEVMAALGREEALGRIADAAVAVNAAVQHGD